MSKIPPSDFLKIPAPKSSLPGRVLKNYSGTTGEDAENFEAAQIVAFETGRNLTLLKPVSQYKVKTADAFDAKTCEFWEIKTNCTPTKSAIDNALRYSKGQSENIILNVKSTISDCTLFEAICDRLRRSKIKKLLIIKNGKVYEYGREYFLK